MWDNEASFVKSFSTALRSHGFWCTRLESHGTANGIPDLYCAGHGNDFFIEFKNDKKLVAKSLSTGKHFKVSWRPGQQAFGMRYYISHLEKKHIFTIIGGADCVVLVPMNKIYEKDYVSSSEAVMFPSIIHCVQYILSHFT